MSISVTCDVCGKSLKAPDSAAGKKSKCPGCNSILRIPEPVYEAESIEDYEVDNDYADSDNPYADPDTRSKKEGKRRACPACGEMILASAVKCRYCDEVFDKELRKSSKSRGRKGSYPLAGPGKRLLGVMADGLAGLVFAGPGIALVIIAGPEDQPGHNESLMIAGAAALLLGMLLLFVVHLYFLITSSQSIGKYLVKTQILDYQTHEPASFAKCFLVRSLLNSFIGAVPCLGGIYSLVDALMVFGEENRCLHDQLAGTYVVDIS